MSPSPRAAPLAAPRPPRPAETRAIHSRLLKCALVVEEARAYWQHARVGVAPDPERAFEEYWFGAKSLPRIKVLLSNFRARFDAFPSALSVLIGWRHMTPDTRALICHWHLQLTDPIYRSFTGDFLVRRRADHAHISRDRVVEWVSDQGPGRWTLGTRIEFASKLLSSAYAAGLIGSARDPRPLIYPRVGDEPLTYLLYLLREVDFDGTLLDNPYLGSVGLDGAPLKDRLRTLAAVQLRHQGDLFELRWAYPSLQAWAASWEAS